MSTPLLPTLRSHTSLSCSVGAARDEALESGAGGADGGVPEADGGASEADGGVPEADGGVPEEDGPVSALCPARRAAA